MPYRLWLKLAAVATALALLAAIAEAWRADRRDRAQLAAELAATKQLLAAADARQRNRDAQLAQTLSALDSQKRAVITPAQILRELQKNFLLPAPLTLQQASKNDSDRRGTINRALLADIGAGSSATGSRATLGRPAANASEAPTPEGNRPQQAVPPPPNTQKPTSDGAVIPHADLKPLYDFTLDCQSCQAKLSTAQSDLADEKAKTAALTKERDDAVRVAKGGNAWRRVTRAAKWFLLGAAAGAVIAKAR